MNESGTALDDWRNEMLRDISGDDIKRALDALLSLAYNDPDGHWVEEVLRGLLVAECDLQMRKLAVICLGHVARIHGTISVDSVSKLRSLQDDFTLGGIAEDALGDISSFAPKAME